MYALSNTVVAATKTCTIRHRKSSRWNSQNQKPENAAAAGGKTNQQSGPAP